MRILFVENHQTFADVAVATFLRDDHVTIVPSIDAALSLAVQEFDAVLVDYDLDDGKGDSFVRELRRRNPTVPIVAVSSHAEGNAALCAAGANISCAKKDFRQIRELITGLLPVP